MRLGLLCPGQGDQTPAMFHILAGHAEADVILDLAAARLAEDPRHISADRLVINAIAQPVLCAYQLAVWRVLQAHLPTPVVFAGYSVGELTAHGCAGALEAEAVIELAMRRAALMDAASDRPGGLMAVRGLLAPDLAALSAAASCELAIINDTDRLVVGGGRDDLAGLEPVLLARGAKVTPLRITIASHTSAMLPAVAPLREELALAGWKRPQALVLAGIDATAVWDSAKAIDSLAHQIARPVDWSGCMTALMEAGCTALLELGPGNGLSRMVRDRFPHIPVRSVSEFRSVAGVVGWLERLD